MTTSIENIKIAVNNADLFVKVPELKGANVKKNPNGSIFFNTGGFNVVFKLSTAQKIWAFRVWHAEMGKIKNRYIAISQYLSNKNLDYFVDFYFKEKGVYVSGKHLDTSIMEWIEGDLMKIYIEKNINTPKKLSKLAKNFKKMCSELRTHKISHGDLQEGNIIITNDDKIKLIDYDSICIPEIEGQKELVRGLNGYQHPSRLKNKQLSLKSDYFSELVIYISIVAIAESNQLWDKYQVKNTRYLLFKETDFEDFKNSDIYKDLSTLSPNIQQLLHVLDIYISTKSFLDLAPFVSYLKAPKIDFFKSNFPKIFIKKPIKLQWKVSPNTTQVTLNKTDVTNENEFEIWIKKDTSFTLTASNNIGKDEKTIHVETSKEKPKIIYFNSNCPNDHVKSSKDITLEWEVNNFEKIELNRGIGDVTNKQKIKIKAPKDNAVYILKATTFFGQVSTKRISFNVTKQAPIIHAFDSTKRLIESPKKPAKLMWNVDNAEKILINNIDVTNKTFLDVCPKKDTTYELTAISYFNVIKKKKLRIEVSKTPPKINRFYADKNLFKIVGNANIYWDVENADRIELSNVGDVTNLSSATVKVDKEVVLTLKATSYFGVSSSMNLPIRVIKSPPIIKQFSCDKNIVEDDTPVTLKWEVDNAINVGIDNGIGLVDSKNTMSISITQDTTFTLTAESYFGKEASRSFKVSISKRPPKILTFKAEKAMLELGETTKLIWNFENAKEIFIDNGIGDVVPNGNVLIQPKTDKTYTITARSHFGYETKAHVYIKILRRPKLISNSIKLIELPKLKKSKLNLKTINK